MTDYISREVAIEAFECGNQSKYYPFEVRNRLRDILAADVREVVYCKDCVYSQAWYADKRICRLWNEEDGNSVFNDGYCNYGAKTYADALNCCADMREETNETV